MSSELSDRIPDLLAMMYDAAWDPARWEDFIAAVGATFRGHSIVFAQDGHNTSSDIFATAGFERSALSSYADYFASINPWIPRAAPLPPGTVFADDDLLARRELERTEFHVDWLRPQRISHSIGSIVDNDGIRNTHLSVLRTADAGPYDGGERAAFAILTGHLRRAMQIHRQLAAARLERDAAAAGLDRLGTAALLVDAGGRVLYANRAAQDLIEERDGLSERGGRVVCLMPDQTARLHSLVRSAAATAAARGESSGGPLHLSRRTRPPLTALVCPMPAPGPLGASMQAPGALIFVRDPHRPVRPAAESLRHLFGLTPAEAKLAVALAEGRSIDEVATTTGVRPQTLRSHLKAIMAKTGTQRQAALVALLLRSAAVL
jgi:DNA-binding CsgD family transcriptional regulator